MLELMHFAEEMLELSEVRVPTLVAAGKKEMDMAKALIAIMTEKWDPEAWKDQYQEELEKVILEKIKAGDKRAAPKAKAQRATNVIDLLSVLQESLKTGATAKKAPAKKRKATKPAAKQKAG